MKAIVLTAILVVAMFVFTSLVALIKDYNNGFFYTGIIGMIQRFISKL